MLSEGGRIGQAGDRENRKRIGGKGRERRRKEEIEKKYLKIFN